MVYKSSLLGEVDDEIVEFFLKNKQLVKTKEQMKAFIETARKLTGFGVLRTGVLWVETNGKRSDTVGSGLESYLLGVGFERASDIVKLFAVNQTLIEDMVERGYNIKDSVYNYDIKQRLKILGLKSRTIEKSYADELFLSIYPLAIELPEVPPPPAVCYRTQLAYLYVAKYKRDSTPKVVAEFRVWGVSYEKGKYEIAKFERVIMQMERIFKGEGSRPVHWLKSLDKVIKASEEDEEVDCDEAGMDLNYALRGGAFRDEIGKESAVEYNEKWIKFVERSMIDKGQLVTKFDNEAGILVNVTDILKRKDVESEE